MDLKCEIIDAVTPLASSVLRETASSFRARPPSTTMNDETKPSLSPDAVIVNGVNAGEPCCNHTGCKGWPCGKTTTTLLVFTTAVITALVFHFNRVVENLSYSHEGRPFLVNGVALAALPVDGASSDWLWWAPQVGCDEAGPVVRNQTT